MSETLTKHGIRLPPAGQVHAFADGACSGNPGPGGWASVVVGHDGTETVRAGGEPETTNNRMELKAAADAVERATALAGPGGKIVIHVDSTYVRDGIGGWIVGWKKNGWRTSAGKPVKNQELWQELDAAVAAVRKGGILVEFAWVKGHAGHPGNELCDVFAREAIQSVRARRAPRAAAALLALAMSAGLLPSASWAQAVPAAPQGTAAQADPGPAGPDTKDSQDGSPKLSAPVQGGWVVNGGEPGDWGFMMGPTGSPDMQMRLIRSNTDRSGALGFMCSRKDGGMQMALALPGVAYEVDKDIDVTLTVADRSNKLRLIVRSAPPAGQPPLFEAAGLPVPDVLKSMGEVPDDRVDAHMTFDDGQGHKASFGLTKPRAVAQQAAQICAGWAVAAAASRAAPKGTVIPPPPDVPLADLPHLQPQVHSVPDAPTAVPQPSPTTVQPPGALAAPSLLLPGVDVPTAGIHGGR